MAENDVNHGNMAKTVEETKKDKIARDLEQANDYFADDFDMLEANDNCAAKVFKCDSARPKSVQKRKRGTRAGAHIQQDRFMRFLYKMSSAHYNWGPKHRKFPSTYEKPSTSPNQHENFENKKD
ncbi:uncharacterized protein [Mycetomoellerius zeteki]|uniref:uncharacterized protein n=1 Tax=Mycetomoellerius zeteki TaxID=64791 RepID=UPI00084ECEA1|nr:PREDICTED: uncharacterized protein LOC108727999 [Trachymyrmex zeteki]